MPSPPAFRRWSHGLPWAMPVGLGVAFYAWAQTPSPHPLVVQRAATGEATLSLTAPAGEPWLFESSTDLLTWEPLHAGLSNGTLSYTDSGSPYRPRRYYRATPVPAAGLVTGDKIATNEGVVTIKPIYHGSFYLHWASGSGTRIIYSDPSSQGAPAGRFDGLPKADLVLVTHRHGDHLNTGTLDSVRNGEVTKIIAPQDAYDAMGSTTLGTTLKGMTTIFRTGQTAAANNSLPLTVLGLTIEGVPAYNANHVKGNCNSYILTIGGKRFSISGDTGMTVELNAMPDIDVAFLCMNVPFTMTVADAAAATRTFRPKIIYPYHLRNSDGTFANTALFKATVAADLGIEVRLRNWY